jgi:hypothetical protein
MFSPAQRPCGQGLGRAANTARTRASASSVLSVRPASASATPASIDART